MSMGYGSIVLESIRHGTVGLKRKSDVKSVLTAMKFTIDDKHLMDVNEKIHRKTLVQDVFDRRRSLDGVKTLMKISM